MLSIWTLVFATLVYIAILFVVATLGNKQKKLPRSVYSLALGVHCTSWAFFGTATQAANFGWALVPTYAGIVLVMMFGFSLLVRINAICKQYKITSIAEFIGVRYEHSNLIAYTVTLICFLGVIPYIALQLDAISSAISVLVNTTQDTSTYVSLYVTIAMAIFAIWFGARRMNLVQQNKGLMLTLAFQSVVKLGALVIIGMYVVYTVFDGFVDLFAQSVVNERASDTLEKPFAYWVYVSHMLLGVSSMFCLPRQFHVNFVENSNDEELHRARWLFPTYLIAMSVFILPIALAGQVLFNESQYATDSLVLAIPVSMGQSNIAIIGFIGGLAASSSMVMIAALALGNMVTNSVITPLWLSITAQKTKKLSAHQIFRTRQLTILVMISIAYLYHVYISEGATLVETGTIAISLLAQTFPAIVLGVYWKQANRTGAILGLSAGVVIIVVGMLYPAVMSVNNVTLKMDEHALASVLFLSLGVNFVCILLGSYVSQHNKLNPYDESALNSSGFRIYYSQLMSLTNQLLPENVSLDFNKQTQFVSEKEDAVVPHNIVFRAENLLSSYVGSASARILLNAISSKNGISRVEMSDLVAKAGKDFQFNKEVLQASITHLPLGVSVVDADLKLVAWNKLYASFFDYPDDFLYVGKPIIEILQYNAQRGLFGNNDQHDEIQKRMHKMLVGESYKTVRHDLFHRVIEISGHPLPAGGFITCFANITEYYKIQKALEQSKAELEQRVIKRTEQLESAKLLAETANTSKTKFLAATSHDLMQPLNAASLFASMLKENLHIFTQSRALPATKQSDTSALLQSEQIALAKSTDLANNLIHSLENAEELLGMLVEITKLENDQIKPNPHPFNLHEMLLGLSKEYRYIAEQKGLSLVYVPTSVWINTDRRLLMRILQNLLSNAIRYTQQGKIVLGVKRHSNKQCTVIVADSGMGIAPEYQHDIFNEFTRIHANDNCPGLGLGLTIVDRISRLLNIKLRLSSTPNKGSLFGVSLPRCKALTSTDAELTTDSLSHASLLVNKQVLVLENDMAVSRAISDLFMSWGAVVLQASDMPSAIQHAVKFDLIMADYHLDRGDTGVDVSLAIKRQYPSIPVILSSADRSEDIQALAYEHNMRYLPKPIKPIALKRLIQRIFN